MGRGQQNSTDAMTPSQSPCSPLIWSQKRMNSNHHTSDPERKEVADGIVLNESATLGPAKRCLSVCKGGVGMRLPLSAVF